MAHTAHRQRTVAGRHRPIAGDVDPNFKAVRHTGIALIVRMAVGWQRIRVAAGPFGSTDEEGMPAAAEPLGHKRHRVGRQCVDVSAISDQFADGRRATIGQRDRSTVRPAREIVGRIQTQGCKDVYPVQTEFQLRQIQIGYVHLDADTITLRQADDRVVRRPHAGVRHRRRIGVRLAEPVVGMHAKQRNRRPYAVDRVLIAEVVLQPGKVFQINIPVTIRVGQLAGIRHFHIRAEQAGWDIRGEMREIHGKGLGCHGQLRHSGPAGKLDDIALLHRQTADDVPVRVKGEHLGRHCWSRAKPQRLPVNPVPALTIAIGVVAQGGQCRASAKDQAAAVRVVQVGQPIAVVVQPVAAITARSLGRFGAGRDTADDTAAVGVADVRARARACA